MSALDTLIRGSADLAERRAASSDPKRAPAVAEAKKDEEESFNSWLCGAPAQGDGFAASEVPHTPARVTKCFPGAGHPSAGNGLSMKTETTILLPVARDGALLDAGEKKDRKRPPELGAPPRNAELHGSLPPIACAGIAELFLGTLSARERGTTQAGGTPALVGGAESSLTRPGRAPDLQVLVADAAGYPTKESTSLSNGPAGPPALGERPREPSAGSSHSSDFRALGTDSAECRTSEPPQESSPATRGPALGTRDSAPSGGLDVSGTHRLEIVVLREETHLAPAAFSPPNDQIAAWIAIENGVADGSARKKAGTREANPTSDVSAREPQAIGTASKLLSLRLDQPSVGAVSIRMRLAGTSLGLEVEAERSDTADFLAEGRDDLVEKLRSAGYATETLVVKRATRRGRLPVDGSGDVDGHSDGVPVARLDE